MTGTPSFHESRRASRVATNLHSVRYDRGNTAYGKLRHFSMLGTLTLACGLLACSEAPTEPASDLATAPTANLATVITISPTAPTVEVGSTVTLTAVNGSGTVLVPRWSSSNPAIATVNEAGVVRGVAAGTTLVTARVRSASRSEVVTVTAPSPSLATIVLNPTTVSIAPGTTLQLSAAAFDGSGNSMSGVSFSWTSSDAQVATVTSAGVVSALTVGVALVSAIADGKTATATVTVAAPASAPPAGIWIGAAELTALPTSGSAWTSVKATADSNCGVVDLANQDQNNNVCILAKALVYARVGGTQYRDAVLAALRSIVNAGPYTGTALALGRELAAYVVAADVIGLARLDPALDALFRIRLSALLTTPTINGPANLIQCHEKRPNNWGTHCGASRVAVAAYLNDTIALARSAQVFRGWLGDRSSYAGFTYGELTWQCNASAPVGINPAGCTKNGYSIDGVLPDDQRRAGSFSWPPPKENYVYEALQGAIVQANILARRGYDVWNWEDRALLRAFQWLHTQAGFAATGDDSWEPHLINRIYGTAFPGPVPAQPGKNMGWTDWTHR